MINNDIFLAKLCIPKKQAKQNVSFFAFNNILNIIYCNCNFLFIRLFPKVVQRNKAKLEVFFFVFLTTFSIAIIAITIFIYFFQIVQTS